MSRPFFYFKFVHRYKYGFGRLEVRGNTEGLLSITDTEEEREYEGVLQRGPFKMVDGEVQKLEIGLLDVPSLIHMLQLAVKTSEEAPKE